MKVAYNKKANRWEFEGAFADKDVAKGAGFRWDATNKRWYTQVNGIAKKLVKIVVESDLHLLEGEASSRSASVLHFDQVSSLYFLDISFEEKDLAKDAGFWWHKGRKQWVTKEAEVAAKFAACADGSELKKQVEEAAAFRLSTQVASMAGDADIAVPAPRDLNYLPFQKAGIKFASEHANTLIADDMGLGKTIQALGLINNDSNIRKVLVVCPASLKRNWEKEARKWLVRDMSVQVIRKEWDGSADVVIVNYDILKKYADEIRSIQWDLVVADEAHYCKSSTAVRSIFLLGGEHKGSSICPIPAKRRVYLTGTPILNRPVEMWTLAHSLDPVQFSNFMGYAKRYCNAQHSGYGWDFKGASHLQELHDKLRKAFMIRRCKKDVLKELPRKIRQVIELPANGHQSQVDVEQGVFSKVEERIAALRAAVELAKASASFEEYSLAVEALKEGTSAAFTELSELRHTTALSKISYVVDHVTDALECGEKVVLFCHHQDVAEQLKSSFSGITDVAMVHGGIKIDDRQAEVDRFQNNDGTQLFVGTIGAAGVGHTLTAAHIVIFAELDWVPANVSQAEDRCHRIGQTDTVLVQHLVLEGSIDAVMADKIISKQRIIDAALDAGTFAVVDSTPVLPMRGSDLSQEEDEKEISREEVEKMAPVLRTEDISIIHGAVRTVAERCDGAYQLDGSGYNRFDAKLGRTLANSAALTDRQAVVALNMVYKYRKQLQAVVVEELRKIKIKVSNFS